MIKLHYNLSVNLKSARPIFTAYINGIKCICMLDTGADIPVFCKGYDLFKAIFLSNDLDIVFYKDSSISGFGLHKETTRLYNFSDFYLSDGSSTICYKNMKIAITDKPNIPCDIILSASMFIKMRYMFDYLSASPYLEIEAERDTYGTGFYAGNDTIYTFASINDNYISECEEPKNIAAWFRKLFKK